LQEIIPVDVITTFNVIGEINPLYIRLENDDHELITHKIESVKTVNKVKIGGFHSFIFNCNIIKNDTLVEIILRTL